MSLFGESVPSFGTSMSPAPPFWLASDKSSAFCGVCGSGRGLGERGGRGRDPIDLCPMLPTLERTLEEILTTYQSLSPFVNVVFQQVYLVDVVIQCL